MISPRMLAQSIWYQQVSDSQHIQIDIYRHINGYYTHKYLEYSYVGWYNLFTPLTIHKNEKCHDADFVVNHDRDVIVSTIASQITSLAIVYSTAYSGADQCKHQSSASLTFVRGIHRWPVNSPQKRLVMRKMFPFDKAIHHVIGLHIVTTTTYGTASVGKNYQHANSRFSQCLCVRLCISFTMMNKEWCKLEWRNSCPLMRELFLCLFPGLGNKYENNTGVSAQTVRHECAYIILFLTRHNRPINDDKVDLHSSIPCLTRSVYVLLMTSRLITKRRITVVTRAREKWKVISNSLDIGFIHYDNHGRLCKNACSI